MIAALFVQENGCYDNLHNIDTWTKKRDARLYNGKFPVIAHPPCQLWGKMAIINYKRWGGEHNKPGNDYGCFESALNSVNNWGGVLEHPAQSYAWDKYKLDKPKTIGWQKSLFGGWTCEVWQSAYGHKANKATWLYYKGNKPPFNLNWNRLIGSHQIGYQDQRGKNKNKPTLKKNEAIATPIKFRDELIKLALHSCN
jgi:hypothetical protein